MHLEIFPLSKVVDEKYSVIFSNKNSFGIHWMMLSK
jgi:hypothetical protein